MADHLYNGWCDKTATTVRNGCSFHLLSELTGGRAASFPRIVSTISSHYEDPDRFAESAKRWGFKKAAKVLRKMLPQTKKARSGHVGEVLATEVVPLVDASFQVPIKRLRWLDGRESALRGEDII